MKDRHLLDRPGVSSLVLVICALAGCARNPPSVSLSLSLVPGMERATRFITEQRVGSSTGMRTRPEDFSFSLVYRFHVLSVDSARTAKLDCTIAEAKTMHVTPAAEAFMKTLAGQRLVVTVDKDGRILALKSDTSSGSAPGGPLAPGLLAPRTPAPGDLQSFFGGLNGGKVTVGDTWVSALPQSAGQGLQGTIHWTLASAAGTTARLEYSGRLEQKDVPLPQLPPGRRAVLKGDVSGYVLLELDTGWPVQGRSVITVEVTARDTGAPDALSTRLVSLSIVTRFEPAR